MSLKVLIVPDKFKGTLTARAAADAIAQGWRRARPGDELELLPMSDGGDGFGEVFSALLGAKARWVETVDAAHRLCRARWWWEPKSKTAIIESAQVIGLAQLPPQKFHPFQLDTFGLGDVIRAAAAQGARRCLIGIGGSATNDGGFGLARSLGWEFRDCAGNILTQWIQLHTLANIMAPKQTRWFDQLLVAVDVQNPLLGAHGCTRIYGPQKGLTKSDLPQAERCLRQLATVVRREMGLHYAVGLGAGAAGGLGFGFRSFLGARLQPGFDLFARQAALRRRLRAADLVITGEGGIDRSTLMGKGVGQIAQWCHEWKIPCLGLAGTIAGLSQGCFTEAHALTELTTITEATKQPALWLRRLTAQTAPNFARNCSRKL